MTKLKDLKFKKISDLNDEIPDISRRPLDSLLKSSNLIYEHAEKDLQDLDEESAYIHFIKYFGIIRLIKKHPEYQKDKDYFDIILSPIKMKRSIKMAEELRSSLEKRYAKNTGNLTTIPKSTSKPQLPTRTPSPPPFSKEEPPLPPSANRNFKPEQKNSTTNGNNISSVYYYVKENGEKINFISIKDFYSLLNRRDVGLLIMDCRPTGEYSASNLKYEYCINIPEEIISKNGMSAGKIQSKLCDKDKRYWSSRLIKQKIILMDFNSSSDKINEPLKKLINVLLFWDQDRDYKDILLILDGGYETVISTYPMITTNPYFVAESTGTVIDENYDNEKIEKIEYPNINDILMKTFISISPNFGPLVSSYFRPMVDRSSKVAAEKTYFTNKTENLSEQIALANESVRLQEDALIAEEELENLIVDKKNGTELELANEKILQLNNQLIVINDERASKQAKIESLERELIELKKVENLKNDITAEDDVVANRKMDELRRKDEELSKKKKIIEERREKQQENVLKQIIPKSQPTFDRSIKPGNNIIEPVIYRDFKPELGKQFRGLTGLRNLGNSCYMNSIIQCLSNTTPLKEYFMSDKGYKKDSKKISKDKGYLAAELCAVFNEIWTKGHKYISILNLRLIIGEFQEIFRNNAQQDSHEFLTIIIDWLNSDLESSIMRSPTSEISPSQRAWLKFIQDKQSYVQDLFYGQIKSLIKCYVCNKESATYDGFSNLSLQVPNERCNISNCLDLYFLGEKIDGWNCPKCKTKRNAVKKLDISIIPPILVIHFKRFNIDTSTDYSFKKNKYFISFDLNGLNMFKYIVPSEKVKIGEKNCIYNLYAVSNHYGTMERGHYTAFCKNDQNGDWYKYDDNVVTPMNEKDVQSNAAYILFYKRNNI